MNIKDLNIFKRAMDPVLEDLPISKMEDDIIKSINPTVKRLYESLLTTEKSIDSIRELHYFHNYGIMGIYVFMDCVYSEPLEYLLHLSGLPGVEAKPPRCWRVNKKFQERKIVHG